MTALLRIAIVMTTLVLLAGCGPGREERTVDPIAPFILGEVRTLHSGILEQDRVLNVYLPDGYATDSVPVPVIYVLDGSANEDFPHIAGLVQFMNMYDLVPKSIVVGIANTDRQHDFTDATSNDSDKVWVPTYGGSPAFIDFLGTELEPFVEAHYRTSGHRVIIGQSLGGLLAVQVLMERPELFDDYIIVSPSLWWNDGALCRKADAYFAEHGALDKRVFIALGEEGPEMQAGVDRLVQALAERAEDPLHWWYVPFKDESHATILHRAVYRAFEQLNADK
ncbi:MAG: alpha/beta hydrolase [Flavobacteriales bacterium]|nr:alpha/beta hydrolase [Flavobacteriales bacterium]MCB9168446.1 alpha/beta hydrolase [Flavobacteriales bacterium]